MTVRYESPGMNSFRRSSSITERKEGHSTKKGEASNARYDHASFERFIRVVAMETISLISTSSSANDRTLQHDIIDVMY